MTGKWSKVEWRDHGRSRPPVVEWPIFDGSVSQRTNSVRSAALLQQPTSSSVEIETKYWFCAGDGWRVGDASRSLSLCCPDLRCHRTLGEEEGGGKGGLRRMSECNWWQLKRRCVSVWNCMLPFGVRQPTRSVVCPCGQSLVVPEANTKQPPVGAHVNVRWEECRPSEALVFDVTTTLTRAEWVEVLFTRTDAVLRAACALELKFEGKHGSGVGAKYAAPSTLPWEILASALAINAWLCALALACQMTKCAALDTTQHGATKSNVLTRAKKVLWQGGEVTVHRDQQGEMFLDHFNKECIKSAKEAKDEGRDRGLASWTCSAGDVWSRCHETLVTCNIRVENREATTIWTLTTSTVWSTRWKNQHSQWPHVQKWRGFVCSRKLLVQALQRVTTDPPIYCWYLLEL